MKENNIPHAGVHVMLVDKSGAALRDVDTAVRVNSTEWTVDTTSGHFWRLLGAGQHEVSVGEVTKLVTIVPGGFNLVKFELSRGMSRFLAFCLTTATLLFGLLMFWLSW